MYIRESQLSKYDVEEFPFDDTRYLIEADFDDLQPASAEEEAIIQFWIDKDLRNKGAF